MKLSLAWIFDHIDIESSSWQHYSVEMIAQRFNEVTAEIEHVHPRKVSLNNFFLAVDKGANSWLIDEQQTITELPSRAQSDFVDEKQIHTAYIVKQTATGYTWASLADFGLETDKLVPAVYAPTSLQNGMWKKLWDLEDYIIEVDNKSITHRPDMWSHRGFAREIAPFIGKKLRPASNFLAKHKVLRLQENFSTQADAPVIVKNEEPGLCKTFNGLTLDALDHRPCDIKILGRLLSVGARPMSGIIDLTNYIALDWGQPMHAYDADKIAQQGVVIRKAIAGEELLLLDGNAIRLTAEDLVIADTQKPMCLAGVKGGMHDSVSPATKRVFIEGANFDAGTVRRSALRHKTRTDSSARFEKTLDPNLALESIQRFIALADSCNIAYTISSPIIAQGKEIQAKTITIEHAFLEKRMGIALASDQVKELLTSLEFGVVYDAEHQLYTITVPTFRASKDINIKEDILEEVVRTYGFKNIPLVLPTMTRRPASLKPLMRLRAIKRYLAHADGCIETQNYALYDEAFLKSIGLEQPTTVNLLNPVSENYARLISSLIPGILKNVVENHLHHDVLRFFETGRVWTEVDGAIIERKSLGICVVAKRTAINFYACKEAITNLLVALGFNENDITWTQVTNPATAWYKPYQTATITLRGEQIGTLGKGNPLFLSKLGLQEEIDAAFAELDLEKMLTLEIPVQHFNPISKFPETFLDFSCMVPLHVQAATVTEALKTASSYVQRIDLIDFFEKEEWGNKRALTFRMWLLNPEGTLEKATLDTIWQTAVNKITEFGVAVRTA